MDKKVLVGIERRRRFVCHGQSPERTGYEVEGVSLILFDLLSRKALGKAPCCSVEAASDAIKTANAIGIRHSHVDVRDLFSEKVIRPFIEAYSKGLTPNPCILFDQLLNSRRL